jgi:hypothetical protein
MFVFKGIRRKPLVCCIALAQEYLNVAAKVIGPQRYLEGGRHGVKLARDAVYFDARDFECVRTQKIGPR